MKFDFARTLRFGRNWNRPPERYEEPPPPMPMRWRRVERGDQLTSDFLTAEVTAMKRLQASLTPSQWQSMMDNNWFEVVSNRGNRWRIITNRQIGNVFQVGRGGCSYRQYCTAFRSRSMDPFPPADLYLAQALTLVTDEASFLSVAQALLGGDMVIRYQSPKGDTLLDDLTDEQVAAKFKELTAHGFTAFADTKVADPIGPVKSIAEAEKLGATELFFIAPLQGG